MSIEQVKMKVKLVTWDDIVRWTRDLAKLIRSSGYQPDVIVAIARGGYVPARLLCDYLNVVDLLSIKVEHWVETGRHIEHAYVKYPLNVDLRGRRVLLVDDICDTGESIIVSREHILENCKPAELRVATMQWIPSTAKIKPDYFVDEVKEWIWYMYPWNFTEDMVNLTRRIMKLEPNKAWTPEEIASLFKQAYNLSFDVSLHKEILEEMVIRGFAERADGGYRLKR